METDAVAAMVAAQFGFELDPAMAERGHTIRTALNAHQFSGLVPIPDDDHRRPNYNADQLYEVLMGIGDSR